jgi:hypothetical protein
VVTVGDDIEHWSRVVFQICKNTQKYPAKIYKWWLECQVLLSGSTIYIQKIKYPWGCQKWKKPMIHTMAYQEGGHMTNFPQWSKKTKVIALQLVVHNPC